MSFPLIQKKQLDNTSFRYCFGVWKAGYCDIYLNRPISR